MPFETEADWIRRKSQGQVEELLGVFIIVAGGAISFAAAASYSCCDATVPDTIILLYFVVFIFCCVLIWHGSQLIAKAKHIAWTKEAMREYDATGTRAVKKLAAGELSQSTNKIHYVMQCPCGHKIDTYAEPGERLQCGQCERFYNVGR